VELVAEGDNPDSSVANIYGHLGIAYYDATGEELRYTVIIE
jgi:hypothetical protein